MSRDGSANGSGFNATVYTMLKIAVLTPIPRPRMTTTSAVNAGALTSIRQARRRS